MPNGSGEQSRRPWITNAVRGHATITCRLHSEGETMQTLTYKNREIKVDDEGYLLNSEDWDEEVACALTQTVEGVEECDLTKERMDILKFMRDYYRLYEAFPVVRSVCKQVHQPKECLYERFIDPIKAWKIAGLPKPMTDVFSYIDHEIS
jgi:tRNA 2-thiouridine synthesizing protein E